MEDVKLRKCGPKFQEFMISIYNTEDIYKYNIERPQFTNSCYRINMFENLWSVSRTILKPAKAPKAEGSQKPGPSAKAKAKAKSKSKAKAPGRKRGAEPEEPEEEEEEEETEKPKAPKRKRK